ncbi:MAG: STAS-like domain-containing protein [Paludibacter sp.]
MSKINDNLISKKGNEIHFHDLKNPKVIFDFIEIINESYDLKDKHFVLNFEGSKASFPNVCTPISGILETLTTNGFSFEYINLSKYLQKLSIEKPIKVSENKHLVEKALDKVWRFDSADEIYLLINSFVSELSQVIICEKGVLDGFEWSINEVLDNILQHSGKTFGYVMGQVHKRTKHFAFCAYDSGNGIYLSLLNSVHKPKSPIEALTLAVKEGVTRDKKIGQGNGLWGLHQIVSENIGKLTISSNSAIYSLTNNICRSFENTPQLPHNNGCIVDFQIDYNKEISISKALGGYEPVNMKIESMEDDFGNVVIDLKSKESGVGTRKSGEKIRNEVININKQSGKIITLNFENLNIISSSFADELIGKLVSEYGFYTFNNIVKMKNMNTSVQSIVQRSVAQRMIESFDIKNK